jgi:hypothetical protein
MTDDRAIIRFGKNVNALSNRRFIDPIHAALNVCLTPSEKVTALNVPLTSFENTLVDLLQRELYWLSYLANPSIYDEPVEGTEVVRAVLDWVISDPRFSVMFSQFTALKVSSAAFAYEVTDQLMKIPPIAEAMNCQVQSDKMQRRANDLENRADKKDQCSEDGEGDGDENEQGEYGSGNEFDGEDDFDNGDGDEGGEDGDGEGEMTSDEMRQQAKNLRLEAEKMSQKAEKALEGLSSVAASLGRAGSIERGRQFGGQVKAFLDAWGIEEGRGLDLSPKDLFFLMKMIGDTALANMASLIGRVHGVAQKTIQGRAPVQVMVDDVGYTKRIPFLFPQEVVSLTDFNPYREQAIQEYLKDGLPGITQSTQSVYEGTFIAAVDESGSMDQVPNGAESRDHTRAVIAKAIALGLAKAARENGQLFDIFGFGTSSQQTESMKPTTSSADLLRWAAHNFDGGTNFDSAICHALEIFWELEEDERYSSDFLMITDGECDINQDTVDAFAEAREKYGVRFILLYIGSDDSFQKNTMTKELQTISDKIIKFTGVDEIAQALATEVWAQ